MKIIFFDTETSGLNCQKCQIIELAMITVVDGEIVDQYDKFIRYDKNLPKKVVKLTGITDELLDEKGLSEERVANDLKEKMLGCDWMVAHNAQFDLSFIYALLEKYFPNEVDDIVKNVSWLDTLSVLKDRKNYPHKLIDAVKYYKSKDDDFRRAIDNIDFHRAGEDTKALYYVTKAMKKERDDLSEYENIFGYNPKWGVGGKRFEFIKYKAQFYHNKGTLHPNEILPKK